MADMVVPKKSDFIFKSGKFGTSADDRILFIVGSGHVEILHNFLEESGLFEIESALQYL